MQAIIKDSFLKSYTYSEYRNIVSEHLQQGKSTGNDQSDDLLHYSKLNDTRMNRLDKTLEFDKNSIETFDALKNNYYWLVISEGWCGDAAQLLPIFNKIALASDKIELKVVFRDENEPLMNLFLTNGGKAIPQLIILDKETLDFKGNWGPRPEGSASLIREYKAKHGVVDETAKTELQLWYHNDKGLSTIKELSTLMNQLEEKHFQTS
jgi:hypothetical protein